MSNVMSSNSKHQSKKNGKQQILPEDGTNKCLHQLTGMKKKCERCWHHSGFKKCLSATFCSSHFACNDILNTSTTPMLLPAENCISTFIHLLMIFSINLIQNGMLTETAQEMEYLLDIITDILYIKTFIHLILNVCFSI